MTTVTESACVQCGRAHAESALVCGLCGNLLKRAPASPRIEVSSVATDVPLAGDSEPQETPISAPALPTFGPDDLAELRVRATPWIFLAVGLATAPIFAMTPFLGYMGWFLASLVHEMGHSAVAWLCGMPAIPAISLDGHAAAMHGGQQIVLAGMIWLALGVTAWTWLAGRARIIGIALVLGLYPALAFTGAKELVHLLAGHGGELVFATLCLWKTLDGGFTDSRVERGLYGMLGWYLLGSNLSLCFGLMTSDDARTHYAENGSFGMTNDYIRVAEEVLEWRLESVAACMFAVSLLVLPAALFMWRTSTRARGAR